jgi:D-serine deaminase-like pyridoxal phosphate-dependent protein
MMAPMHAEALRARLDAATADLHPPLAVIDLEAFDANASELERRASGCPIRVASKSVRCRALLERVLEREGFRGILAFTLPEALWLAGAGHDDIVVAYPTADRGALRDLAASEPVAASVTLMVDSTEHLELIEGVAGAARPAAVRVCIDLDASWRPLRRPGLAVGARRSPIHTPAAARALAEEIARRPALRLVGLMAYEAQVAGVPDRPPRRPLRGAAIRWFQPRSAAELAERRAAAVAAVREVTELEFVNGGGTGSLERTAAESSVTEVAAGSGLYGPALFDDYSHFRPRPAAFFALPVVRRPGPDVATLLGGGLLASGPGDRSRLPRPALPAGLRLDPLEGAGEVQTPVLGRAARDLRLGDRVWMRHAKAGELCEHFDTLALVSGDRVTAAVPTYRGEGRTFL